MLKREQHVPGPGWVMAAGSGVEESHGKGGTWGHRMSAAWPGGLPSHLEVLPIW